MSGGTTSPALGLGVDVGGTATRWALADAAGTVVARGELQGFTALMMGNEAGRAEVARKLAALGQAVRDAGHGVPAQARMGITGDTGNASERPVLRELAQRLAAAVGMPEHAITVSGDVVFAYHAAFAPGEGYLVYAGTGSIGIHVDAQHAVHRAGGHGSYLGDEGSGYWIAREALRHIWRQEDEAPGAWQRSPMAREVLEHVGGSDWSHSRQFIYTVDRGEMGKLALAVAASAGSDPVALRLLEAAGSELGRLARILVQRFGPRPVALAGRVFQLHPVIEQACRAAVPEPAALQVRVSHGHHAAARIAARAAQTSA